MEAENKKRGLRINNGALMCTAEGENFFKTIINGDGIIDIGSVTGKIDKDTDIKVDSNNVETSNGKKLDDVLNNLRTDTDKAVEELTNRADQQIERANELANYIDSLTDEVGVFKIETENALATKVADTEFQSYRMQTAKDIADKVSSNTFESWRTQSAQMIADKVSSSTFESYRTQTDREIMDRVKSSEFNSYIYQTDKKISMVVDDYGNINTAEITVAIQNDSSFIRMIADRIEIKPNDGIIHFPNGSDIDTNSGAIRLRWAAHDYVLVGSNGMAIYNGSGTAVWLFNKDGAYFKGNKVL